MFSFWSHYYIVISYKVTDSEIVHKEFNVTNPETGVKVPEVLKKRKFFLLTVSSCHNLCGSICDLKHQLIWLLLYLTAPFDSLSGLGPFTQFSNVTTSLCGTVVTVSRLGYPTSHLRIEPLNLPSVLLSVRKDSSPVRIPRTEWKCGSVYFTTLNNSHFWL